VTRILCGGELTRVTVAGTGIPREWAYVAVWLACGLAALLSLLIAATATRGAGSSGPASSLTWRKDAIDTRVPDALGFVW
jgi:TRAP-type C4-dicarboxylate transport system permease small subunit